MLANFSSNCSGITLFYFCCSTASIYTFTALFVSYILFLLPLFIYIFYIGYQQWRKQRFVAMAAMTSHSDVFTYNMVTLELIGVLGSLIYCSGAYTQQNNVILVGLLIFSLISPAQSLCHLLACVERYLAVVHPVTYLRLKQVGGFRIRNASIGGVWLISFGLNGLSIISNNNFKTIFGLMFLFFEVVVVAFCSLSVLHILIRPGPGNVGRIRKHVDQTKQRAFCTIMVILGTLLLRFLSSLVLYFAKKDVCLLMWVIAWFSLPSSLVLPLLFLHRVGKLPGCKHNNEST